MQGFRPAPEELWQDGYGGRNASGLRSPGGKEAAQARHGRSAPRCAAIAAGDFFGRGGVVSIDPG